MRILLAGATGVLGRATLRHLHRHEVVGLTRSPSKLELVRGLGAEPALCDVYDDEALVRIVQRVRPSIVVNFVTDLAGGSAAANNRARREGGRNLLNAARVADVQRLVVESVAFELQGDAAHALKELERSAREFLRESAILRFGRLWGPGTSYRAPPSPPAVHIERAGAEAARLLVDAASGAYVVTDPVPDT